MAKKTRTPPPPRRPVQAPKRRVDARAPSENRRTLIYLMLFALSGLVILGAVLLFLALKGGDSSAAVGPRMQAAGCTFKTYPNQGRQHFSAAAATQPYKYNSFPPTSGTHDPTPAIFNAYEEPINERKLVHNLEHGGVVIQYGKDVPASTVEQLRGFYQDSPNGIVLAPLPRLNDKIALTAWTHLSTCTEFDEGAFKTFRDAYRAKGPEPFRLQDLAPGS
ncbi:MAG TPA: DUF3105 domain-containing protein [Gaiellaceae bacterium]|nr:DUF3105 domain-containing protein [Gaiellaceae bacterium]